MLSKIAVQFISCIPWGPLVNHASSQAWPLWVWRFPWDVRAWGWQLSKAHWWDYGSICDNPVERGVLGISLMAMWPQNTTQKCRFTRMWDSFPPSVSWMARWWWTHTELCFFFHSQVDSNEVLHVNVTVLCCYLSSVRMRRKRRRNNLINSSPVTCSAFTPFILWTEKKCFWFFPPLSLSFFAYLWICMFASCSFLLVYVFCR